MERTSLIAALSGTRIPHGPTITVMAIVESGNDVQIAPHTWVALRRSPTHRWAGPSALCAASRSVRRHAWRDVQIDGLNCASSQDEIGQPIREDIPRNPVNAAAPEQPRNDQGHEISARCFA
jgi:hypothetical protein